MSVIADEIPIFDDETLANYCARIAAAHDLPSAMAFGTYTGFGFLGLQNGRKADVCAFAEAVGAPPETFDRATIRKYDSAMIEVRGDLFTRRFFALRHNRFCAQCLLDDEAAPNGPPHSRAYIRMSWLPRFVHTCDVHNQELTELPSLSRYVVGDFYSLRRSLHSDLGSLARVATRRVCSDFERFFLARFRGHGGNNTWMDDIPLQAISHACELVGLVHAHGPHKDFNELSIAKRVHCSSVGYATLEKGKRSFEDVISNGAQAFYDKSKTRNKLVASVMFGALATEMMYYSDLPGYQTLLDLMQDVAIRELPIGPGDDFFGPVRRRELHSVWTARKIYKIGRNAMVTHLMSSGIIPTGSDPDVQGRVVFKAADLEVAMKNVEYSVSTAKALKQLRVNLWELRALVSEGLLSSRSMTSVKGKVEFGFFKQSEIDDVLERLAQFTLDGQAKLEATTSLRTIKHHVGFAIRLLFENSLPQSGLVFPSLGFEGLYFNPAEFRRAKARIPSPLMNHRQVMDFLRVDREAVHALAREGYIVRQKVKEGAKTEFFPRPQVEEFLKTHASIGKLVTITRRNRSNVVAWISANKVEPSISIGTDFFRISDIRLNREKNRA